MINKPIGLTVHPAAGHYDDTLVNALLYHCKGTLSGIGGVMRPGIVHRLDKDTSGVMVSAKNDKAHHHLSQQFADHSITRTYHAVVRGTPKTQTGTITGNIGRHPHHRQKMALLPTGGKHAVTHYNVLKQAVYDGYVIASLVEFTLETGRTHQIRVHASSSGFALVGDSLYAPNQHYFLQKAPVDIADAIKNFPVQALHAKILGFLHPKNNKYVEFESDYNDILKELVEKLFK